MTPKEDFYFNPPSNPSQSGPLTTAWKKLVEDRDGAYSFWTKCWGQKDQPSLQLTDDYINLFPEHLRASLPPQIPVFPVWNLRNNARPALIRDEYEKIYKWFEDTSKGFKNCREATMITGHPNIGKTIFREFVLYRRCTEQKPTLYHDPFDQELFLFYGDGVASLSLRDDKSSFEDHFCIFTSNTWLLVDGIRGVEEVPPILLSPNMVNGPRIIFTASPTHISRFERWGDGKLHQRRIYMQGWNDLEIMLGYED
ncbi:hypothetical protein MPER_12413 [Moniliophthora perniciosa FA553]|nr:hypothetical protein MPER_12413 [Moniliophthora perniciosa FA553]